MTKLKAEVPVGSGGRLVIEKPRDAARRLRERFRQIEGRSLAEELLRERRAEAQRDSSGT